MRALALAALILLPLASGGSAAPVGDLIVTLREGTGSPDPAPALVPLAAFPGYVLLDATRADLARLSADPRVERVDLAKPLAYSTTARLPSHAFHGLTRADGTTLEGRGVTVAVVDSGIDGAHPDLAGRVLRNVQLLQGAFVPSIGDPDGHGTHVAGVLGASGVSSGGRFSGVAPGVDLVGIDISTRFTTASAVLAYDWLHVNRNDLGLDIVVNAWGRVDQETFDPRDPVMRAVDRVVADGIVVVFSASNHGPDGMTLSAEAMHPRVVTVGATDAAGLLASYSSRGPPKGGDWLKPDVVAPGDSVVGPRSSRALQRDGDPDALHTVYSGTSQAAPHVAGIVAMMLEARPDLTPEEVGHALRASAVDLGAPGPDDATGYGLVDAADAIRGALGLLPERDHILIAGGVDRYRDATEIAPTPRRGLFDLLARPDVVWEAPFPVRPGATRLRASFDAQGADGVALELVHAGHVHPAEVDDPAPGVWTMRVRASVPFAARAEALVEATLPPDPARALAYDGRAAILPPPAPSARSFGGPLDPDLSLALGIAAAALATAAAVAWSRREK